MQSKMSYFMGGGSCDFQPSFRGRSVLFQMEGGGGGGRVFSNHHIFKCTASVLFDQSLILSFLS